MTRIKVEFYKIHVKVGIYIKIKSLILYRINTHNLQNKKKCAYVV